MSVNGGYAIIDFEGTDFTVGTEKTLAGIYDRIESRYNKPTLVSGLSIGTVEQPDAYVFFEVVSGDFVGTFGSYIITVADDDGVTITEVE